MFTMTVCRESADVEPKPIGLVVPQLRATPQYAARPNSARRNRVFFLADPIIAFFSERALGGKGFENHYAQV